MGEIILLAVGAIVWAVIKAISNPPPKAQQGQSPYSPSSRTARGELDMVNDLLSSPTPAAAYKPLFPAKGPSLKEEAESDWEPLFSDDEVRRGFIMAEVLGPPLAKRQRRR